MSTAGCQAGWSLRLACCDRCLPVLRDMTLIRRDATKCTLYNTSELVSTQLSGFAAAVAAAADQLAPCVVVLHCCIALVAEPAQKLIYWVRVHRHCL
jgi:hypothetical protein